METKRITLTYDLETSYSEECIRLIVEAVAYYTPDTYGEDADGNRGINVLDVEVKDVVIYDEKQNDITLMIEEKHSSDYEKILDELDEKARDY